MIFPCDPCPEDQREDTHQDRNTDQKRNEHHIRFCPRARYRVILTLKKIRRIIDRDRIPFPGNRLVSHR